MSDPVDREMARIFASDDETEDRQETFSNESGSEEEITSESESDGDDAWQDAEAAVDTDADADVWSTMSTLRQIDHTALPTYHINAAEYPIEYFNILFTTHFFTTLVSSVNTHATAIFLESLLERDNCRIFRWVDTNVTEMKTFLALLFHMGHIKLNRINDYWRRGKLFNLPFSNFMGRDRFLLILRCLYYTDQAHYDTTTERYAQPIINFFNNRMQELVTPIRNLTIDETIVSWRGRLHIKQYIKGKRHKYGIKLYVLTDANGLSLKLHMYNGASDSLVGGRGHTKKVVLLLLDKYLNRGHAVYMDNFYNSVELAETLLANKTYLTGTLRANRSRNPSFVTARVPRGSCIFKFNRRGVCVGNYNDKRRVLMISTQHSGEMVETCHRRRGTVHKPRMVVKYNKYMNGVDRKDQMLSYYSCYSKSMRWYNKIITHILQLMFFNAYKLFSHRKNEQMTYYDFRLNVVENLLNISNQTDRQRDRPRSDQRTTDLGEIIHLPVSCPKNNKGKTKQRRCALCFRKNRIRKQVMFYCPMCPQQPGLCLTCFREFHNYKDL